MAAIKSYTDIHQSKRLAEILPIETADMIYRILPGVKDNMPNQYIAVVPDIPAFASDIPCWSLVALLGVLPFVDFTAPQLIGTPKTSYRCIYSKDLKSHAYDNPIDTCYEMVLKLNELNLL